MADPPVTSQKGLSIGGVAIADMDAFVANLKKIADKGNFSTPSNKEYPDGVVQKIHKALRDRIIKDHPTMKADDATIWPVIYFQILARVAVRQTVANTKFTADNKYAYSGGDNFAVSVEIHDQTIRDIVVDAAGGKTESSPNPERKYFHSASGVWMKFAQKIADARESGVDLCVKWGLPESFRIVKPDFLIGTPDMTIDECEALRIKTREAIAMKNESAPMGQQVIHSTTQLSRGFGFGGRN